MNQATDSDTYTHGHIPPSKEMQNYRILELKGPLGTIWPEHPVAEEPSNSPADSRPRPAQISTVDSRC